MIGQVLFYNKIMEASIKKSKEDAIKRGRATTWGAAAGIGNYLVMKNAGEFIAGEATPMSKKYNVKSDKLKQIVNRAYKDMGGKGAPPKVRLGSIPGAAGGYSPQTHTVKLPLRGIPTKKTIDKDKYINKAFGKMPSFKRINEIINRGVATATMGQKTGVARTKLHHIYHEVGHSVAKRGPIASTINQLRRPSTIAGAAIGAKVASKDNDKRAPLKGAAIGAALSSGTLASEIAPEVRIYKMLKKRGIKPIKAAKWVVKNSTRNLTGVAAKPLAIGIGVGAVGTNYRYFMNKKKNPK